MGVSSSHIIRRAAAAAGSTSSSSSASSSSGASSSRSAAAAGTAAAGTAAAATAAVTAGGTVTPVGGSDGGASASASASASALASALSPQNDSCISSSSSSSSCSSSPKSPSPREASRSDADPKEWNVPPIPRLPGRQAIKHPKRPHSDKPFGSFAALRRPRHLKPPRVKPKNSDDHADGNASSGGASGFRLLQSQVLVRHGDRSAVRFVEDPAVDWARILGFPNAVKQAEQLRQGSQSHQAWKLGEDDSPQDLYTASGGGGGGGEGGNVTVKDARDNDLRADEEAAVVASVAQGAWLQGRVGGKWNLWNVVAQDTLLPEAVRPQFRCLCPIKTESCDNHKVSDYNPVTGQLTIRGKAQLRHFGEALRRYYIEEEGLVPEDYRSTAVAVESTNIRRTLQSAMFVCSGLYPENSIDIGVQADRSRQVMFAPLAPGLCPPFVKELSRFRQIYDGDSPPDDVNPDIVIGPRLHQEIKDHILKSPVPEHLMHAGEQQDVRWTGLFDQVHARQAYSSQLPCWGPLTSPNAQLGVEQLNLMRWARLYHDNRVTVTLGAGRFMHQMRRRIKQRLAANGPNLYVDVGHDTTVLMMVGALGGQFLRWPPYASFIIVELWHLQDAPLDDSNTIDPDKVFVRVIINDTPIPVPDSLSSKYNLRKPAPAESQNSEPPVPWMLRLEGRIDRAQLDAAHRSGLVPLSQLMALLDDLAMDPEQEPFVVAPAISRSNL